jgi:ADP-ribose pyrophosphatase YjhB (NUDIX family)
MNNPKLISFIETVLATAQAGVTFSKDPFDLERFASLRAAASSLLSGECAFDEGAVAQWIELDQDYPTPKLDVRAFIVDAQKRVLLVRELRDGLWTLPGGWCDIGESPARSVEREVLEETGLTCKATRLLALFDKHCHPHPPQMPHAYKAFFLCEAAGGSLLQSTNETSGAEYFEITALPELSVHRVLASQLTLLHRRIMENSVDTLFD